MTDRVLIIAEAGVNHNGRLDLALKLVEAAAAAGADVVKFQTFRSSSLVTVSAQKAAYQKAATGGSQGQLEMLKALELSEADHRALLDACRVHDIAFMSTPFDEASLEFLAGSLAVSTLKVGSGDLTNSPLLLKAARWGRPIILSTGMGLLAEVEHALAALAYGYCTTDGVPRSSQDCLDVLARPEAWSRLLANVTLLHCTTEYPAPYESVNLKAMDTLAAAFGLPVGYSDHTRGIHISVAAVARGAVAIEKHFTLDRKMPGPDHAASLEPDELAQMVRAIRDTEVAIGDGRKLPAGAEAANKGIARRSLVAMRSIAKGEPFTPDNITSKRPGGGIPPNRAFDVYGRPASRAYEADEVIEP